MIRKLQHSALNTATKQRQKLFCSDWNIAKTILDILFFLRVEIWDEGFQIRFRNYCLEFVIFYQLLSIFLLFVLKLFYYFIILFMFFLEQDYDFYYFLFIF